ncbi:MAG: hypothetical protein U0941_05195 [Planctomycetaceae bacterium]
MTVKKQPESSVRELYESANDWFRQFLKRLEINMADTGQALRSDSDLAEFRLAAMRAVKLTLRDSGALQDEILNLFGRVAIEKMGTADDLLWTSELNKRRFELIDGDIQGTLSQVEQIELAGLTQLMREHVDSEVNLPFEGARQLHRYLVNLDPHSTESE